MTIPAINFTTSSKDDSSALTLTWFKAPIDDNAKKKSQPTDWAAPIYSGKKDKSLNPWADRLSQSKHFSGAKQETSFFRCLAHENYPSVLMLGLGTKKEWNAEMARQAGASLFLAQRKEKLGTVSIDGQTLAGTAPKGQETYYLQAFCEGYCLAGYSFSSLKTNFSEFDPKGLNVFGLAKPFEKAVEKARILSEAVLFARSLGDRPGNYLTPIMLADILQKMAKEKKLKCTILDRAKLEKEKMGLFVGVAKGSVEEPRMIILEHQGGKKGDKPIVLVGKGITFDAGGISIKPAMKMEEMKYDMMGAAAVSGIMSVVAALGIKQNVIGYIAAAENLPSGTAQKPGDVATSYSGKTVEIINTDAEGRLVLADTIEYAQKNTPPSALIDFATLTGAVVVALGTVTTGIMGTNQKLIDRIREASEYTGERVWQLPLYPEYADDLQSSVADIKNSSDVREAGSQKGGTFLKFFVDESIPWVHCDIAGSGMLRNDLNYAPKKYGAGVMVRCITNLLENWKKV